MRLASLIRAMKSILIIFLTVLGVSSVFGQELADSTYERMGLEHRMGLLNLKLSDFAFRDDYSEIDSFRLETVSDLMNHPYAMVGYTEKMAQELGYGELVYTLKFVSENLKETDREPTDWLVQSEDMAELGTNLYYESIEFNRLLSTIKKAIKGIIEPSQENAFAKLSNSQKSFLTNQFKEVILEDTADASKPVEVIDSIHKAEEKYLKEFLEFGENIDQSQLTRAGIAAANDIYDELYRFLKDLKAQNITYNDILRDTVAIPSRTGIANFLGKAKGWRIGGVGDDIYRGDFTVILDFGGNDRYELDYDVSKPHPCIIIDLSGDDLYNANSDFCLGSGCLSVGLLFDLDGDDVYNAGNFSLGSGYFGFGLLYDNAGSDKYFGDTHCQGAGTFGAGLLIDKSGSDFYNAALFSQGLGMTEGLGMICDYTGHDNYIITSKYPETYGLAGNDQHFLSLSQGFGHGMRPYMSGGIGIISDLAGNDIYQADIFAQGSSYWWALGIIYDGNGNDKYTAHQYAQGAGIHLSNGILFDNKGDDFRKGKGLMQGCGHDYGCGILIDRYGNDINHAFDLSQGGGQANGFGIFIDSRGDDAHYVMRTGSTQGYGNPRRDFGSIGIFLDLSGTDRYDGNGSENSYWDTGSKWGGGMDREFIIKDTTHVDQ